MALNPRRDRILRILAHRKQISVGELTERLGVSEVTIRKDLARLQNEGLLVRTHGGAALAEDRDRNRSLTVRRQEELGAKRGIARTAAELVRDGDTIFIDSGSTCNLLAEYLREMDLHVVTNSLDVLVSLQERPGVHLICIGGSLRREAGSFIGPNALEGLSKYRVDTAFLGTTGFSRDGVFSSQNVIESEVKRRALQVASRNVVLADRTKFGTQAFSVFATAAEVDVVVMDADPETAAAVESLGLELLIAEHGPEGVQEQEPAATPVNHHGRAGKAAPGRAGARRASPGDAEEPDT